MERLFGSTPIQYGTKSFKPTLNIWQQIGGTRPWVRIPHCPLTSLQVKGITMIHKTGNLFDTTGSALGHGVNVDGLMGAGIAKIFRDRYPRNYETYKLRCSLRELQPGKSLAIKEKGVLVVNLASQDRPGPNATYGWLFSSALDAAKKLIAIDIHTLAIPQIGCGIGGLEWDKARAVLRAVETVVDNTDPDSDIAFEFEVWTLAETPTL